MKKIIYTFLFCLSASSIASACSCFDYIYFCEVIKNNSHVVRGEIINKYDIEGVDEFDTKYYMDVLIIENIMGDLTVDTITIVNSANSCEMHHGSFNIGDEVILNSIDENSIDEVSGHPFVSPSSCSSTLLRLTEDEIVEGDIRVDLNSQSYDEFKSEIGVCSALTALDRWIEQLDKRLFIFPNPSSEDVFVVTTFNVNEEASYELYNAAGQLLTKGSWVLSNQIKMDVKSYPRGVYFLKLKIRQQILVRKILKN